jgi:hypothetical protein
MLSGALRFAFDHGERYRMFRQQSTKEFGKTPRAVGQPILM